MAGPKLELSEYLGTFRVWCSNGVWWGSNLRGLGAIALSSPLSEVLPYYPSFPRSHGFLAFAVPFVEDTLPSSSEENRNELLSIKCQVTYPFLRGLP